MIQYYGPRQMQRNIETFVDENILPHIARRGVISLYFGKFVGISMKPRPHFVFDHKENKTIEEAFDMYVTVDPSEKERVYREVRPLFLAASALQEHIAGGYHKDIDILAFPPHKLLDYLHVSPQIDKEFNWENLKDDEWLYTFNALYLPHIISHEVVHWDLGEIQACTDLRKAFSAWEEVAEDPRLIQGNLYEIVNEALANKNSKGMRYSTAWEKIWNLGLYHFNEVIAECVGFALVPSPNGRIYISVEAPDEVVDKVHKKLQEAGIKETLAFAKQLMEDAYRTETHVYDLLRRA